MTLHVSRPLRVLAVGCLLAHCGGMTESPPPVLHHPALTARDSVTLGGTPFAVAISRAGVVYVSRVSADSAARDNLPSESFTTMVPVGPLASQVRISPDGDRKSTRLNSSHSQISYAVFCLKKKNTVDTATKCLRVPSTYPILAYALIYSSPSQAKSCQLITHILIGTSSHHLHLSHQRVRTV